MQLELAAFAEFSEAGPEAYKVWPRDRNAETHRRFRDIVDPVLLQTEAIWLVPSVDEMDDILALGTKSKDVNREVQADRINSRYSWQVW